MKTAITSADEAIWNIKTYVSALRDNPELVARISMHPAWYAAKDEAGAWIFGPSKFIGYKNADARSYLVGYDRGDGRESEAALQRLAQPVDVDSAIGRELVSRFEAFAAAWGKTPKKGSRISLLVQQEPERRVVSGAPISSRIAFDADICGGRPRIAGTRVRVSDIVAALGAGDSVSDILEDYPYLKEGDIYAALDYAAKAVDHRVLRAA